MLKNHWWLAFTLALAANLAILVKLKFWLLLMGMVQLWDFDIYHQTVRAVLAGQNPYHLPYMQISGPPLLLLPFVFFGALPLEIGRGVMNSLNLFAGFAACWVVVRHLTSEKSPPPHVRWTMTLVLNAMLLLTFPARFNFIVGQPNLIIMWLVAILVTSQNGTRRGVVAGALAILKTNYVVIGVSLLRRYTRSFLVTVAVIGAAAVLSLLLFKPQFTWEYVTQRAAGYVVSPSPAAGVDYYNQSLRATAARLDFKHWYFPIFVVLVMGSVVYLLYSSDVTAGVLLSLILSPIIWQHYVVVVYPILVLTGYRLWLHRRWSLGYVVASILLTMHLPYLHSVTAIWPHTMLASHYFVGLLVLLAVQVSTVRSLK